ncbi:hypothetical protein EDF63_1997 [Curtobacterium sp. JUb34]|uniref:hypothetical protein n=1 Tax=Curtobacterium sp. JUb34 TaxID=2485109 RepID=UPI000FAAE42C|nr:hypothetical protein [Curtobacterium sp. JUb34]ROR33582.1 hypothetical protein EDF63_1997 [Curtobacterium sp. JUb34]
MTNRSPSGLRAVGFDLDGTLFDHRTVERSRPCPPNSGMETLVLTALADRRG